MSFAIPDWVAHHALCRPQHIALHGLDNGETRTWAQLENRVARLAGALRGRFGLNPGDRVVALCDGNIRVLELQFACIRAGLTLAPLNFRLTVAELSGMCRLLSPVMMVTDSKWRPTAQVLVDTIGIAHMIDWDSPYGVFETCATEAQPMAPRTNMQGSEVPLVLFTSGSTDAPKATTSNLQAMIWQAFNQAECSRVAEQGSHVFTPLPLFHAGGLHSLTNPVLYFGGKATISARFDASVTARFAGDPANGVTHIGLVPLMYDLVAKTPDFATADFSAWRTAILAGGRMSPALQDVYLAKGVRFSPQYGGTETGPSVTALDPARTDKARAGSCGTPVMHVQIRLVGQDGQDVGQGEPGEIWLKGPAITRGYLNRAPEDDFTDGWFRTGDVATVDEEGYYFLVDRVKDMYKSGGENVSSAEVEQVLSLHPSVQELVVIGVADQIWGEVGLAVVVPRTGHVPTLEGLHETCRDRLAKYKYPRRLALVDSLPRNAMGKVVKHELRARFQGSATA
jgi:fatty-acyl-CoA synthase